MKKLLVFFICLLAFPLSAFAIKECSDNQYLSEIEMLNNVDVSYTVQINNNQPTYTINFKNLTNNIIIMDGNNIYTSNNGKYSYKTNKGGSLRFTLYSKTCRISSSNNPFPNSYINLNLPLYNKYSTREECKDFKDNYICQKWSSYNGNENTFKSDIKKLQDIKNRVKKDETDDGVKTKKKWFEVVREVISKFWWAFIILIFAIIGIFYMIKSKEKKNSFDFKV